MGMGLKSVAKSNGEKRGWVQELRNRSRSDRGIP